MGELPSRYSGMLPLLPKETWNHVVSELEQREDSLLCLSRVSRAFFGLIGPNIKAAIEHAALSGSLDVMKWLWVEDTANAKIHQRTAMENAALSGSLDVLLA